MNDPAKCVILVPCLDGSPIPECEERLRELERRGYKVWRARGFSVLDTAYSRMASDALAQGFEELFWIGPDIVFDPNDVERVREHNLPVVAGLYAKTKERQFAAVFPAGIASVRMGTDGGLVELRYCGLGFMLTRRAVFDTLQQRLKLPACNQRFGVSLIPYFVPLIIKDGNEAHWYLEGDYAFCERASKCGYRIMADTRLRLWRVGDHSFGWEEAGGGIKRTTDFTLNLNPSGKGAALPRANKGAQRNRLHAKPEPLPAGYPRLKAYLMTYAANRDSADLTLRDFRQSDWGEEPVVFEQPADWPAGKPSAARNYKRILEQAINDDCDFALIIEDDVRVCQHLRHNLTNLPIVRRDQCDYLSLFMPDLMSAPWARQEPHLGYRLARPLYSGPNRMWEKNRIWGSQAYLLSHRFLRAAVERWDRLKEGQDTRVISICSELKLPMWYTSPCFVEHAPLRSAFGTPSAFAPDFKKEFRLEVRPGFQPPEEIPGRLTIPEGKMLWQMAQDQSVLELGTGCGRSTVCLAQQARQVTSIDAVDSSEAAEWLQRYGIAERVRLLQGDAVERCRDLDQRFGLAFLDTEPNADSVRRDIKAALPLLEPGALVAFHNYPDPSWPAVRQVVDDFAQRFNWKREAQADYLAVFRIPSVAAAG